MCVSDKVPLVCELLTDSFAILCQICVGARMHFCESLNGVRTCWYVGGVLRSGDAGVTRVCVVVCMRRSLHGLTYMRVRSACSAVGVVRLLVCLTLAMGCCRRGPAEARWGLWSVTQSPQPWIKLMLQIPSLQLSCAPGGRTTFEQRDLVPARGWCLFNMCFECSDWLIPLTGSRREGEWEGEREGGRLLY